MTKRTHYFCLRANFPTKPIPLQRRNHQVADFFRAEAHLARRLAFHLRPGDVVDGFHNPSGGLRLTRVFEQHAHCADGGDGIDDVEARVLRRTATHRLEHADAARIGVEISARRDAKTTLQNRCQVGDDVAEHVGRHDHVIILGRFHHPHAAGINVIIVGLNVGIFFRNFLERPPPQIVAIRQDVGLRNEGQFFLGIVSLAREFKRPADAPLATLASVNGRLLGDFVLGSLFQKTADTAIHVLRVFTNDHEVDVGRAFVFERRFDAGKQFNRPQIDVLIELKAKFKQQTFFKHARRHIGMSHRTEIDRVELSQLVHGPLGQSLARAKIPLAPKVEMRQLIREVFEFGDRFENFESFAGDFGTGTISADDGDIEGLILAQGSAFCRKNYRMRKGPSYPRKGAISRP